MVLNVLLDDGAYMPEYAHDVDAGADLRTPINVTVPAHGSAVIDLGVHIQIPNGYVGMIKSKSGLNVKASLVSEGVVDCGFTGAIKAKLYNHSDNDYTFEKGDKVTQIVIMPIPKVEFNLVNKFEETERGSGGFGSTGR